MANRNEALILEGTYAGQRIALEPQHDFPADLPVNVLIFTRPTQCKTTGIHKTSIGYFTLIESLPVDDFNT